MLEKMRCITGSMRFENGKIRDVLFLGMPKLEQATTLTRSSLSLGTKETFLYLAMLLNLGEKMDTLNQVAAFAGHRRFFRRSAIAASLTLIGKRHSVWRSGRWRIGLPTPTGRRLLVTLAGKGHG